MFFTGIREFIQFGDIADYLLINLDSKSIIKEIQLRGLVSHDTAKRIFKLKQIPYLFGIHKADFTTVNGLTEILEGSFHETDSDVCVNGIVAYASCLYLLYISCERNINKNKIDSLHAFRLIIDYGFSIRARGLAPLMLFFYILKRRITSIPKINVDDYVMTCDLCASFLGSLSIKNDEDKSASLNSDSVSDEYEIFRDLKRHILKIK
jgi:hypothetical protein